jgi:hypothetical protein
LSYSDPITVSENGHFIEKRFALSHGSKVREDSTCTCLASGDGAKLLHCHGGAAGGQLGRPRRAKGTNLCDG